MSNQTLMTRPEREFYRRFGERLHAARKAKGMTQEQVAARLGVTHPTIHYWETAQHRPHLWQLRQLEHVLGTELMT